MDRTQEHREMGVSTPLDQDVLLLRSMTGREELGRLFEYRLDLVSESDDIDFSRLVGDKMTVRLDLPEGEIRYFNGVVSRFVQVGFHGRMTEFEATLVPWFWLLTRNADCRIFQKMTVPDIIKEIFGDRGFSDFEESLTGEYREWEYCVQYRETDFNFISRLMEQEGIYYYFKHEEDKHTLVLSDSITSHETRAGYEDIPYFPPDETAIRERDYISAWTMCHQIQSGTFAHNDFDFEAPKKNLQTKSIVTRDHAESSYEIYDYPGEYVESSDGDTYARIRIEELQQAFETFQGEGNARGLAVGSLFNLTDLPREDQNREYLVVSATYQLHSNAFDTDGASSFPPFACSFATIDSETPYRAARKTQKPMIQGPQTAVISGPSGEEIWTDKYGRVMVQFHWDRYGKSNEESSCWIRVSQLWAGGKWGAIYTPRIGQEVIVEFLEGDPDRPIITGRVYNGSKMPPYDLPAEKTKSTIKSNTTKGGGGSNELRFEDKAGSEEVYLHGQKDWTIVIENDKNQTVGNNETLEVGNDRTKTVKNDQSETITNNKTIEVGVDHTEKIGGNMKLEIEGSQNIKITGNKEEKIGGPHKVTTDGDREEINWSFTKKTTYGVTDETFIGAKNSKNLALTNELFVGAKVSNTIAVTAESFVGAKISVCKAKEIKSTPTLSEIISTKSEHKCATYTLDAITEIGLEAGSTFELKCGGSSIKITPGEIVIKSSLIKFDGEVEGLKDADFKKKLKNPSFEAKP